MKSTILIGLVLLSNRFLCRFLCSQRVTVPLEKTVPAAADGSIQEGMLYYAPQGWTSDDTDVAERLKVQYGTSYCYPVSAMGSHVSAVPNHQVFRKTPMKTRADVAYFGTFGYELDVNKLPEKEQEQIKEQIAFRKQYEKLIREGTFYRLVSPFDSEHGETACSSRSMRDTAG